MKRELTEALVWAAVLIVLAFGANAAHRLGYIDQDTARRVFSGALGLWMAWYGNRIPKRFAPSACARQAQKVSAWSMILSGLLYAGLWAFAPIDVATWVGTGAIFAGMVVTLGYCLSLRSRPRPA
jgi:hypothetical protein